MKILCLHGYGTSAEIMEGQMTTVQNYRDASIEWVFSDGEVECQPATGMSF